MRILMEFWKDFEGFGSFRGVLFFLGPEDTPPCVRDHSSIGNADCRTVYCRDPLLRCPIVRHILDSLVADLLVRFLKASFTSYMRGLPWALIHFPPLFSISSIITMLCIFQSGMLASGFKRQISLC